MLVGGKDEGYLILGNLTPGSETDLSVPTMRNIGEYMRPRA